MGEAELPRMARLGRLRRAWARTDRPVVTVLRAPSLPRRPWATWRARGRTLGRAIRWPLIAALFATAVVLGWIGFDRSLAASGQPGSFLDKLYLSLQLFVLQSGAVSPPVPWQLDVARFLAPATTAYATVSALVAVLGEQISGIRARLSADHVVVCGLGRIGGLVAKGMRGAGYNVVAIEADPRNAALGLCREAGVVVLVGDASDPTLLRRARVERARHLFAVTGDDGTNAKIAIDARRLVEGRQGPPLTCFVHLLDGNLVGALKLVALARRSEDSFRLEAFNAAERGAPALLRGHRAFDDTGMTPFGPPHLLVVGLGEMGSHLVVDAARRWRSLHATTGRRFKVTVVDKQAEHHLAGLVERYPRLRDACEIAAHSVELDSAEFERARFLFDSNGACDVTSVYVCVGDDAVGLSGALHLRYRLGDRRVPIVVRTTQEGGVAAFLGRDVDPEARGDLAVFGLLDVVCRPDVLLNGQNEVLAVAIHEGYVRHRGDAGQAAEPAEADRSAVPWEQLPESLRESNRGQAADIGRKLRAVGCDIEPLADWDAAPLAFTAAEVEFLARMEHDRWRAEREAAGWHLGSAKSEGRRESPFLVPWDELTEETKEKDRNPVRAMPAVLAGIGFGVIRLRPAVGPG